MRKWIFCKHMWMVKLLRIGVLYLMKKLAVIKRSLNCQISNQWNSRNALHVCQYPLHKIKAGNG